MTISPSHRSTDAHPSTHPHTQVYDALWALILHCESPGLDSFAIEVAGLRSKSEHRTALEAREDKRRKSLKSRKEARKSFGADSADNVGPRSRFGSLNSSSLNNLNSLLRADSKPAQEVERPTYVCHQKMAARGDLPRLVQVTTVAWRRRQKKKHMRQR